MKSHHATALSLSTLLLAFGCSSVSEMTALEVENLPDAGLCYLQYVRPVGFIPLEVQRRGKERRLRCSDHDRTILDWIVNEAGRPTYVSNEVPEGMLNRRDCSAIRLGQIVNPKITKSEGTTTLGTLVLKNSTVTTDRRHHQYVKNDSGSPVYVLMNISYKGGPRPSSKLVRVGSWGDDLVLFGSFGPDVRDVTIDSCRVF